MYWFALFLIILSVFAYLRSRSSKEQAETSDTFWEREEHANSIRKQDISQLEYITIPLEELPFKDTNDTKLLEYQNTIKNLSEYKILNLTGISNTDLKLQYGTANLEFLSLADQRFTTLARTISLWGNYLYDEGNVKDATTVLEFGIQCKSDVSANYITLAKIYKETSPEKISGLITQAKELNSLTKNSIVNGILDLA